MKADNRYMRMIERVERLVFVAGFRRAKPALMEEIEKEYRRWREDQRRESEAAKRKALARY